MTRINGPHVRLLNGTKLDWRAAYRAPKARSPHRIVPGGTYDLNIHPNHLDTWRDALAELGLDDPTEATSLADEARRIYKTKAPESPAALARITAELGRGDVTVDDAWRQVAGLDDFAADKTKEGWDRVRLRAASQIARRARLALHEAGESLITEVLAPQAASIVDRASDKRVSVGTWLDLDHTWRLIHDTARMLRGWAVHTAGAAETIDYELGRPDLAYMWRLEQAELIREVDRSESRDEALIYFIAEGSTRIDLRAIVDHADEWHPGLYTAEQVLANASDWDVI